jgi:hypothetical protein
MDCGFGVCGGIGGALLLGAVVHEPERDGTGSERGG